MLRHQILYFVFVVCFQTILSSVMGVMVSSVSEERQRLRSDLIPSLLDLASHADSSLSTPATHSIGLLCGGSLSSKELDGVLNSNIVETLCTRLESESNEVDVLPTLHVLDRLCSGLKKVIKSEEPRTTGRDSEKNDDSFSLTRRCGFALALIEKAVLVVKKAVEGQQNEDKKTLQVQDKIGGMLVRHFSSSIHSSQKEIGEIGINLAAVRREMEAERETARKAEEERQREFSRKMREMEEMMSMNEKWIEEGRQREEEKKREEERKRKEEEEERRRNVKEGAAAIEVFARDKFTVSGNVFTKTVQDCSSLFSIIFGAVVVRITFIVRQSSSPYFPVGIISPNMVEQAIPSIGNFSNLKGAASWCISPSGRYARQNYKGSHPNSACIAVTDGQRVVIEADGRVGKRTLKMSQDGETQPAFFSNIPVPFRFGILLYNVGNSVEIVSTEVLKETSIIGGSLEVVVDE
ncbi:hypothetical protein BLNAU_12419 [Blattamonas nauphoetae]|uniref:Uncharacterized protein n=1 Tax=Blattamonas nauphoetae TaxID=2049346 RepID=A0ABQ9XKQ1_9EUKA|nr:hypothetical protein BLNAU_12419 [Blattamonas nauphoetae]